MKPGQLNTGIVIVRKYFAITVKFNFSSLNSYTPKLNSLPEWDTAVSNYLSNKDNSDKDITDETEGDPTKEEEEHEAVGNIFEAGLSKHTLNILGYKFKSDIPAATEQVKLNATPKITNPELNQAPSSINSSCSSTSTDTPISILKKGPSNLKMPIPMFKVDEDEVSRIEITPGLYVRPKSKLSSREDPLVTPSLNPRRLISKTYLLFFSY